MYKPDFQKHEVIVFRQFQRKGYSLFACLGREVVISVLSVATLSSAKAAGISDETFRVDSAAQVNREVWLSDVGVTGSRAPLALGQAARMVTVLSREDIQAAPVQSVNDLLKLAVGVDVRQRGPLGAQTDVGIRGGTQEQITILLNGINICDPQTGHNVLDLPVDLSEVERVEVMEGPAGRVVGTSSLVGAINIVTNTGHGRRQKDERSPAYAGEAGLETGSYGYAKAAASAWLTSPLPALSTLRQSLSGSYTRSDGFQRSLAGRLNSDYEGVKAFYQGHYDDTNATLSWHAGLNSRGFGSNTFYSPRFDEQYEHTTKLYTALQGETKRGWLHLKPAVYWNRGYDRFELIRGTETTVPFNRHRTDVFGLNLNAYFDSPLGRTAMGAEFRNEDIVSTNLGEPLDQPHGHYVCGLNRSNLNFHLEHNVLLRRLTLSGGFVCVKNTWNEMPFTLYPGADASYRLTDDWKLYASFNTSLRMPSFTELYYSVGGHKADKHLKPEEMSALEVGTKYQSQVVTLSASMFSHRGRNMIDWVMDTRQEEAVWQSVNHTKVNTLGLEATASISLDRLFGGTSTPGDNAAAHFGHGTAARRVSLQYCYMHQEKDEPGYILSQYALEYLRHKLTASLLLPVASRLSLVVDGRYQDRTGSYTDTSGSTHDYKPYFVADAKLSWDEAAYSLYLEANNLTGKQYVDYGNVRQPGRWLTVGAKWRLGN